MLSLPTVQELVARQVQIQDDIESGEIAHDVGMTYIRNISLIISGTETAEQMAKEEPSSEEDGAPIEPTFADDALIDEDSVRRAMVGIYGQVELGKISPVMGAARIKALESIDKTFKNATIVDVNINDYVHEPLPESITQLLSDVEDYKRSGGKHADAFLIEELAIAYNLSIPEVEIATRERKSLAKKRIKPR